MKQSLFKQQAQLAVKLADEAMRDKLSVIPTAKMAQDLHAQGKVIVHKPKSSRQIEIEEKASELLDNWLYEDECEGFLEAASQNHDKFKAIREASSIEDRIDALHDFITACEDYAKKNNNFEDDAETAIFNENYEVKQVDVDHYTVKARV